MDRTNQVIIGARRIGKSSLVNRLKAELGAIVLPSASFKRSTRSVPRCVYLDVSRCEDPVATSLWGYILRGFGVDRRDFSVGGWRSDLLGKRRKEERAGIFDEFSALTYLLSRHSGQLTIILDEVDDWLQSEWSRFWPSLNRLRQLTEHGRARIVLVGYETLAIASKHHRFPLAGRIRARLVPPLEKPDVERLIFEPLLELEIKPDGRSRERCLMRIWQTTSGMPHLVQDICRHLIPLVLGGRAGRRRNLLTIRDVESAIAQSTELRRLRENVVGSDFPLARALAAVCSLGRSSSGGELPEMEDGGSGHSLTLQEMARRLEEFGYEYNDEEIQLALACLELRLILQPANAEKSRWGWLNDLARKSMERSVLDLGYGRYMSSVIRDHRKGKWRDNYGVNPVNVVNPGKVLK